jgi:hypothetical protein
MTVNDDNGEEGEILYGMGLYDAPAPKSSDTLHQSVVLSLLGGVKDEEETDGGRGLGLKLEDAWEPPASPSGDEDEEGEDGDGEGQEDEDE